MACPPGGPSSAGRLRCGGLGRRAVGCRAALASGHRGVDDAGQDRAGQGLVSHYFAAADELVAAAFAHAAEQERDDVFGHAGAAGPPRDQVRRLLAAWLYEDRDPVSLLWPDAWQARGRRPALRDEVARQMHADLDRLSALIRAGAATGDFRIADPRETAIQVLGLIDGLSVQAATRSTLDYTAVRAMVITTTERLLGLGPRTLAGGPR